MTLHFLVTNDLYGYKLRTLKFKVLTRVSLGEKLPNSLQCHKTKDMVSDLANSYSSDFAYKFSTKKQYRELKNGTF